MFNLKKRYFGLVLRLFFNRKKYGEEPSLLGKLIIPLIPKIKGTCNLGKSFIPVYDSYSWLLYCRRGFHEPALEKFIIQHVPVDGTVIDAGANVGIISVLLGSHLRQKGLLISFEPDPYVFNILKNALKVNKLNNTLLVNCGVGKENGEFHFSRIIHAGLSHQIPNVDAKLPKDVYKSSVVRIDDFCRSQKIKRVHFIKIDVDGPDFEALLGAEHFLNHDRPPILAVEVSYYWKSFGYTFKDAFDFLEPLGYKIIIAFRKNSQMIKLEDPAQIPQNWGNERAKAFNFYAWKEGTCPTLDKLYL